MPGLINRQLAGITLLEIQCYVARGDISNGKLILTVSLAQPREKTKEILKIYEYFLHFFLLLVVIYFTAHDVKKIQK